MNYREFGWTKNRISDIGMGTYYGRYYSVLGPFIRPQQGWDSKKAAIDQAIFMYHKQNRQERFASLRKGLNFLYHRGSVKEKIAALRKGLDLGINLIDTAEIYQTEDIVAKAIEGYKRDELFVATKVSGNHLKYDEVFKAANNSLKKLQTSYIDLFQIHWPNLGIPIQDTMKAMEKLVKEEKIRYIGVSNFTVSQMIEAGSALSDNKLASNQVDYSLIERGIEKDLLPYCELRNIVILAYQPIAQGILANPNTRLSLSDISKKYCGKTSVQIALNWLISKSKIVFPIPRASRLKHVVENAGSVGWRLETEDMKRLEDFIIQKNALQVPKKKY